MSENKEALFLLDSQPPHWGELVSVLLKLKDYDQMHICVSGISKIMPIKHVVANWLFVMGAYKNVTISALLIPFADVAVLPEQFKDCTVLTTNREIFVHMSSVGIPVELVPRTLGYHGIFLRTAYRQGRALDWLLKSTQSMLRSNPRKLEEENKNDTNIRDK